MCKVCPDLIPACAPCDSGYTCVIIAQSCNVCAYTSCVPNAEVSTGHYTVGSTVDLSSLSNIVSGTAGASSSTASAVAASTTSGTAAISSSLTTSPSQPTSHPGTSTTGSGSSMSMTSGTAAAGSITSSVSSSVSSAAGSTSPTASTGAAASIGPQAMEMQAFLWVAMALWLGNAVFGGRRWRW